MPCEFLIHFFIIILDTFRLCIFVTNNIKVNFTWRYIFTYLHLYFFPQKLFIMWLNIPIVYMAQAQDLQSWDVEFVIKKRGVCNRYTSLTKKKVFTLFLQYYYKVVFFQSIWLVDCCQLVRLEILLLTFLRKKINSCHAL